MKTTQWTTLTIKLPRPLKARYKAVCKARGKYMRNEIIRAINREVKDG